MKCHTYNPISCTFRLGKYVCLDSSKITTKATHLRTKTKMTTAIHISAHVNGRLDEEAVPGTVHLVDLEGTIQAKHAKGGLSDVVLVPAPSNDPDDPLNWSPMRKMLSTLSMCIYILMTSVASAAIYGAIVPISEETGLSIDRVSFQIKRFDDHIFLTSRLQNSILVLVTCFSRLAGDVSSGRRTTNLAFQCVLTC